MLLTLLSNPIACVINHQKEYIVSVTYTWSTRTEGHTRFISSGSPSEIW